MVNRFGRDTWSVVETRWIKNCQGRKKQSINICRPTNRDGDYEEKFYFTGQWRVSNADLQRFTKLSDLSAWLRRRAYLQKS